MLVVDFNLFNKLGQQEHRTWRVDDEMTIGDVLREAIHHSYIPDVSRVCIVSTRAATEQDMRTVKSFPIPRLS